MELDIKIIRELMECMNENKLDVLKIVTQEINISLERHNNTLQIEAPLENRATHTNNVIVEAPSLQVAPSQATAITEVKGNVVKSPIVGTFFAAPSPDKEPFVKVGSQVKKGDVIFIIESMKLMNEITSEYDGVIAEIIVENGKTVEYGQPILRIE
jgi:acetyl-CoA carboxylase biotin carboxyl carrier protein